jgi:hypothetical protein
MSRLLCLTLLSIGFIAFMRPAVSETPTPVAYVIAIDGKLEVKRPSSETWAQMALQKPDYVGDHLRTSGESVAAIEFTRGGKIGINAGTEIEITSERAATDVTDRSSLATLSVKAGSIWAKFTKQQEQFKLQTESCVIGVRGTEFVVELDGDETSVSVLEGEVEVTDGEQQVTRVRPGEVVAVRRGKRAQRRMEKLQQMRKRLDTRHKRLYRFVRDRMYKAAIQAARQGPQPTPRTTPRRRRIP